MFDDDGSFRSRFRTVVLEKVYGETEREEFVAANADLLVGGGEAEDWVEASADWNNWQVVVSYVTNFKAMNSKGLVCPERAHDWWDMEMGSAYANMTLTHMWVPAVEEDWGPRYCDASERDRIEFPFYVVAQGHVGKEIVQVTGIEGSCALGGPGAVFSIVRSEVAAQRLNFSLRASEERPPDYPEPGEWLCDPAAYNSKNPVCDCECGVFDPDCFLTGGSSAKCLEEETCSLLGKCVTWRASDLERTSPLMVLSELCERPIMSPGTNYVVGFVGSEETLTEGGCSLCPYEDIYGSMAMWDKSSSSFVCTIGTKGRMDPVFQDGDQVFSSDDYVKLNISLYGAAPFPSVTPGEDKSEILVMLDGEQTRCLESSSIHPLYGTQELSLQAEFGNSAIMSHIGIGMIFGAVSTRSNELWVRPWPLQIGGRLSFPESGFPYVVTDDIGVQFTVNEVVSEQLPAMRSFVQILRLAEYPEHNIGLRVRLSGPLAPGSLVFNISFDSTQDSYSPNYPERLLIYDIDDLQNAEIVLIEEIIGWHSWSNDEGCGIENYFARDGVWFVFCFFPFSSFSTSNCVCGQYDPDCGTPTPKKFADEGGWVVGCDEDEYCSYPAGECTADSPTYDSGVEGEQLIYTVVLQNPTESAHAGGSSVMSYYLPSERIEVRKIVDVSLQRQESEKPFPPSERAEPQINEPFASPPVLDAEVAVFIHPDKSPFDDGAFLCPESEVDNETPLKLDYLNWILKDDGHLTVECRDIVVVAPGADDLNAEESRRSVSKARDRQQRKTGVRQRRTDGGGLCQDVGSIDDEDLGMMCASEMPVTHEFQFDVNIPVTQRFEEMMDSVDDTLVALSDTIYDAETTFDIEQIFHFSYDPGVEDSEFAFAAGKSRGGDSTTEEEERRYFGSLGYRGTGNGSVKWAPASVPYLFSTLNLGIPGNGMERAQNWDRWPGSGSEELQLLFDDFQSVDLKWASGDDEDDTYQRVVLAPGLSYTFYAKLQL